MLCRRVYEGIPLGGSEKCAVKQIEIPIVYNKYGDYDPNGLLYVLKKDAARIRKEAFSHSLNRALSIHVQGLRYEVQTSDGASVGYNRDSTTKNQILYTWYADKEGVYSLQDMGDTRSSEEGTNVHGLFGAIIIEPPGAVWYRSFSLAKALHEEEIVVTAPGTECFRECVVMLTD